ncbi:MAG: DUF1559 domain-containing protein, partial [Planctomycetia bacterium]|nr:DUF1559 domain-containing protein [Planctomycetia bacterium]
MKPWVRIGAVGATIAFIGGVVAASLRARQEARDAQCVNSLRMIGLGLSDYHDIFESFPLGTVQNPTLPPERRLSWIVGAWSMVGDGQIHLNIDRDKGWNDPVNARPTGYSGVDGPGSTCELFFPGCPGNPHTLPRGYSRVLQYVGVGGLGVD